MPVRRADRRHGRGQVDGARGAASGSARRCSRATRSCTSSTKDRELRDAVVARFGAEVAPGGVVDRAAVARRAFADEEERAGSRGCSGRWWARASQEWLARARAMRPAPRAAVVEVPLLFEAGMERAVRRDDRGRRRRSGCAAQRAARAGTRSSTSARRASSRRRRRRGGRRSWCATTAARKSSSASCRRCLTKLGG